jgi:hypothetical protein
MVVLYDPFRVFLPLGLLLSLVGILAWVAGLLAARRLVFPNSAIFLFSVAILVWLLGFISEQVSSLRVSYHGDETVVVEGQPES